MYESIGVTEFARVDRGPRQDARPWLDPIGRPEGPLPGQHAAPESPFGGPHKQPRGDARIELFNVISLGKSIATVRWQTDANAEILLSLFVAGRSDAVVTVRRESPAGFEREFLFDGLEPGTNYRVIAVTESDRQEIGFETLEEWMQ